MHGSDRDYLPGFLALEMRSLLVARALIKVSRRVLFVSIATRAGVLITVLAWRSLVMRGGVYFRADPDCTDSPFDRMLDVGRIMTR